jgi:hypothetical protein
MSSDFNPIIGYCQQFLGLELESWEEQWLDGLLARRVETEPPWRHIPGYAEFEVNREGDVRNVLTKLPLKAIGTASRKQAFMLRADNGTKRMIYSDWIIKQAFPN